MIPPLDFSANIRAQVATNCGTRSEMNTFQTDSSAATEAVAAEFAQGLTLGDVVLLSGDLGSGKTTFVRGACRALGVTVPVTSPSYTVGNVYPGPIEIAHVDLYRLESGPADLADEASLDDYLTPQRIGFVEWPRDQVDGRAEIYASVTIEHADGDRRLITIKPIRHAQSERS